MKKEDRKEIAQAAAKNIKSEADLNELKQMLTKMTLETVLNAELDEHLGYAKHDKSNTTNSRNGYTTKTLQTEDGQFELETPRDRNGDFEPQLVKKNQRRFVSMNDKILFLYDKVYQLAKSVIRSKKCTILIYLPLLFQRSPTR